MNDNLDDYDFAPTSSSTLSSLFDSSSILDNSSLIYTAPKQPKPVAPLEIKNETPKSESSVICARVVQVWKLNDNKYIAIGKHGLAIIGSSTQNTYEIILYKEKRNVIVRIKICPNFEISLKTGNFASFYDNLKENWLVKFNNTDDCMIVINQIEHFGGKIIKLLKTENEQIASTAKKDSELENSDNPENKAKADILSRIAKMGQSILPNKNLNEQEDDKHIENETEIDIIRTSSPPNVVQVPKHFQNVPNTVVIGQPMNYDPFNLYLAENRAQNSEVRINLSQISDKVNQILKLVESEPAKPVDSSTALKSKIKVLDLRIENLIKEIKTVQEENAKLKLQIKQQELKKSEVQQTQEEAFKIISLGEDIVGYQTHIKNLSETVEIQKNQIEKLKFEIEKKTADDLELKNTIKHFQDIELENKDKMTNFIAILKDSMNTLYGNIRGNLDDEKNYPTSEVSSIIAQNIKSTTLDIIQNFQQIYKNDSET